MNKQLQPTLTLLHIASGDLWAGAEVQIYYLAQKLQQQAEIDLHVVLLNDFTLSKKLQAIGVKTHILDESRLSGVNILVKLIKLARTLHPDIIHTHRQKENVLGSIAALFAGKAVCIRTQHGGEEHFPKLYQIHKFIFKLADRMAGKLFQKIIVAVSEELALKLSKIYRPHKIRTINNGINLGEIQQKSTQILPRLPGSENAIKIGLFARLVPVKRLDIAIKSIQILRSSKNKNYCLYIFGDGPLREDVERMIADQQLENCVFVMGHQDNAYPYMKAMDFSLITSDHEGLPMNLLEAMCLKTCVVAHAVGGIPAALEYGKSGILIEQNTPENYAEHIANVNVTTDITKLTDRAYQNCLDNYSSDHTCHQMLEVYRSLKRPQASKPPIK